MRLHGHRHREDGAARIFGNPRRKLPTRSRPRRFSRKLVVMATVVSRMALEEFLDQPGDTFHDFHELHNGEVVEVPAPTLEHYQTQKRVVQLLSARCADRYTADREFYFTLPSEARRADAVMVFKQRIEDQGKRTFFGSPDLVIEILSPSNSHLDVDHLRNACFNDQCVEFWVINLEIRMVTVYGRNRAVRLCISGDELSLSAFGITSAIEVASIFE